MASGRTPGTDREAMLRRVAIVLSNLPAPVAAKLLGTMDADSKQTVRHTMSTLIDVDPLEQRRALQAFKGFVTQQASSAKVVSADGDALQIQSDGNRNSVGYSARVLPASYPASRKRFPQDDLNATAAVSERHTAAATKLDGKENEREPWSLASLDHVDDANLSRMLRSEHPQTIALVLASISPEQAARVLPRFEPELRQETISRIGRLGEIPATALSEVTEHFRRRLEADQSREQPSLGRQALDAILAAMPKRTPVGADPQGDATSNTHSRNPDRDWHTDDPSYQLIQRLRLAERSWASPQQRQTESSDASHFKSGSAEQNAHAETARHPRESSGKERGIQQLRLMTDDSSPEVTATTSESHRAFPSAADVHQRLIELTPTQLCQSLGLVDARDAILALCGLPVHVAEAALAVLPRIQAKQARAKINSLESLELREIDRAKATVAEASLTLLPSPVLMISRAA